MAPKAPPAQDETAPTRRRRLSRSDRERQLIETAEQAFAERGAAVTMEEIAERAGVTKPVVYDHFASKDALIAACFEKARKELFRLTTEAASTATTPEEAAWRTLRTFFGFVADHAGAWSVLSAQGAVRGTPAGDEIRAMRATQSTITAGLLAYALPDLDERRAQVLVQAVDGACEQVALGFSSDTDLDLVTDDLVEVVWLGVRSLRDGERWVRSWT